jgi:hypothetical protein
MQQRVRLGRAAEGIEHVRRRQRRRQGHGAACAEALHQSMCRFEGPRSTSALASVLPAALHRVRRDCGRV